MTRKSVIITAFCAVLTIVLFAAGTQAAGLEIEAGAGRSVTSFYLIGDNGSKIAYSGIMEDLGAAGILFWNDKDGIGASYLRRTGAVDATTSLIPYTNKNATAATERGQLFVCSKLSSVRVEGGYGYEKITANPTIYGMDTTVFNYAFFNFMEELWKNSWIAANGELGGRYNFYTTSNSATRNKTIHPQMNNTFGFSAMLPLEIRMLDNTRLLLSPWYEFTYTGCGSEIFHTDDGDITYAGGTYNDYGINLQLKFVF